VAELYEPLHLCRTFLGTATAFCGPGEGGKLMDSGATQMDGLARSTLRRGLSTNCIGATAMIRVARRPSR
jgi:hypothetical protein